jgi:hypothetical protein
MGLGIGAQRRQGKEVYNRETRRVQRLHTIYTRTPEVYWTKQDVLERIRSKASKGTRPPHARTHARVCVTCTHASLHARARAHARTQHTA